MRLLALLPLAVLLSSCGGGYGGSSSSSSSASSGGGSVLRTIPISEKEYSLTPGTVTVAKPGTYAFQISNKGKITHAFTIEASGGRNELEAGDIQPGSQKTVKYTFKAGTSYEMYCPIDGHKAQGMAGTISVGVAAGGGTTTKPEGQTTTSSSPGY